MRDLAKRRDTFMQILEHEFTDKPTCGKPQLLRQRQRQTKQIYMRALVWPDTHRLDASAKHLTNLHKYVLQYAHMCITSQTSPSSTQT